MVQAASHTHNYFLLHSFPQPVMHTFRIQTDNGHETFGYEWHQEKMLFFHKDLIQQGYIVITKKKKKKNLIWSHH